MKEKGLYNKYIVKKTDGSPIDPEKFYFVLCPSHDPAALAALKIYTVHCENEKFRKDLFKKIAELEGHNRFKKIVKKIESASG